MITKFKKQFMLYFDNLWQMAAIYGGIWLAGFLITAGVMVFGRENDYANLGVLFSLIFGSFFLLMVNIVFFAMNFETAVKMGRTRKEFLTVTMAVLVVQHLSFAVLITFIGLIDTALANLFFSAKLSHEFIKIDLTFFGIVVIVMFGVLIAGMFLGTLVQRFGKTAFWIIWGIYMVFAFGGTGISSLAKNPNSLLGRIAAISTSFFQSLTLPAIIALCVCCVIAIITTSVILLRKAPMRN